MDKIGITGLGLTVWMYRMVKNDSLFCKCTGVNITEAFIDVDTMVRVVIERLVTGWASRHTPIRTLGIYTTLNAHFTHRFLFQSGI